MTITDIINKVYLLTNTNSISLSSANALLLVNNAYEKVASKIISVDKKWQWDDNNQTDLPIATTNIVSGQQDYSMTVDHLKILRVEVADSNGTFNVIEPFDYQTEKDSLTQLSTETGVPYRYDKVGQSIILYPKPNYNETAGLKVYFQRGPALFTSAEVTTGTKKPGFNSLYHDLIPLWASYDYAVAKGMSNANQLFNEILRIERALVSDYQGRDKTDSDVMTMKKINYI